MKMKTYNIEYELPPLRAIYTGSLDAETESEARELFYKAKPGHKIRKITQACTVESVNRTVIDGQLLAALDDKSKVAILATVDDLNLFIEALTPMWAHTKAQEMLADLKQLKMAAFPNEK